MKQVLLLVALFLSVTGAAQDSDTASARVPRAEVVKENYAYCEILCNHLPSHRPEGVIFDFGQATDTWKYNWLENDQQQKFTFNSGIEALNYMVGRGWEFVQAFTSGESNQNTHYLLRISVSALTETQRQQLRAQPRTEKGKSAKSKDRN